jgi:hypothetical protein
MGEAAKLRNRLVLVPSDGAGRYPRKQRTGVSEEMNGPTDDPSVVLLDIGDVDERSLGSFRGNRLGLPCSHLRMVVPTGGLTSTPLPARQCAVSVTGAGFHKGGTPVRAMASVSGSVCVSVTLLLALAVRARNGWIGPF